MISYYSIIVPTFNRSDEISELLHSFETLEFDRNKFELIIVDDGSTDNTEEIVKNFSAGNDINIKYINQNNKGPGAARNAGMENAKGDFFIFIDSDCTVAENWLQEIDKGITKLSADAYGGPDSCKKSFPPLLKAINYSMTSFITTGGIRGHKKKKLGKFYPRSFNMGLTRELYEKIGGFGSLRHGQDMEYSNRIIRNGAKIAQIQSAIVFHKRRTSIYKFFKQVFNWGVARINLFKIDKSMLEPVHTLPAFALCFGIILVIVALFFPPVRTVFKYLLYLFLTMLLLSAIHAYFIYKNLKTALLILVIIPVQIAGYGMGFSYAVIKRLLLGHGEFTGYSKQYYK